MLCPYDNAELYEVRIESHYGQPLFLEQCKSCGGIWFDKTELYKAKHGEAEKVELLDAEGFRTQSEIHNARFLCPKDQSELLQFTDKFFPVEIIVERCGICDGFWLQHGEFMQYQETREELRRPKEKTAEDKMFEENAEKILAMHSQRGATDALGRLGKFLSTPIDRNTMRPIESPNRSPSEDRALDLTVNILITILRAITRT
jgi:Zn-finger nucleic acid-binding protein